MVIETHDVVMAGGPSRARRVGWALIASALLLGGAACGSSDSSDGGDAEEGSTEEGSTEEDGADEEGSTEEGSTEEAGADEGGADEDGADETAEDVTWDLDASQFQSAVGTTVAFDCSEDGTIGSVWGSGTYTSDSSVCSAAVHAGLISVEDGGRVVIEITPGEESYEGSEANGVTSTEYGSWPGSFTFPDAD